MSVSATASCPNRLPRPCERDGYQDPNHCNRCRCPDGFSGTYCHDVAPPVNGKYPTVITVYALGDLYPKSCVSWKSETMSLKRFRGLAILSSSTSYLPYGLANQHLPGVFDPLLTKWILLVGYQIDQPFILDASLNVVSKNLIY